MLYNRQNFTAQRIIVVTFYIMKVFGFWPYKFQDADHQLEYSFLSIIYSIFAPILSLIAYVYIGFVLYAGDSKWLSSQIFASLPLQLIVILYSYMVIISYVILYAGQLFQYKRKKIVYFKCKKVADCMRECRTEVVDIQQFVTKFLLKTIVYDLLNFLLFYYNMVSTSIKVRSQLYLPIFVYLPVFSIRLNTNVFFGGILFFNALYKQLNKSLNEIHLLLKTQRILAAELFNLNIRLEQLSMLYFELAEAMRAFNSLFSFQITLWIITQLIMLTTQCFYQYVAVVHVIESKESYFEAQNVTIIGSIVMSMYELFTTAHACNLLVKEVKL